MHLFSSYLKYIIIAFVVLLLGTGGVYLAQKKSTVISPGESVSPTPAPKVELATWNDESGFSFQYPKNLSVNKHEEDNENYAHVELTNADHPGKIIVWVKDAPKIWPPTGGTTLDTMLGGLAAKKILTAAPVRMLTVGTVSEGLLFSVEATLTDSEYWTGVHDTITNSFTFTQDTSAPAAGQSSGDSVDEEEVVE